LAKKKSGAAFGLRRLPKPLAAPATLKRWILTDTEEAYLWTVPPASFSIPEFDRFDYTAISGKIDGARLAAGRNAIANEKLFVRTVMKVNDDFLEENFAAFDAQLDGAETTIVFAYVNIVVILAPVHVGVAEIIPALRLSADGGECEREQESDGCQSNSFEHISSAVIP
jgi:hypothetical protein